MSQVATSDPFDLQRFVDAQAPIYDTVCRELGAGRKRNHWIWYIFPQLRGLGRSETARFFGISSLAEARAYASHAILGPRLRHCTELMLAIDGRGLAEIMDDPDPLKFVSSMTLFEAAATDPAPFAAALARYADGKRDQATLEFLARR